MDGPLHVSLVGPFATRVGDQLIPPAAFGGALGRRLLRALAVAQGQGVSRDALAEALWGVRHPANPDANLAVQVSRIRRATGRPDVVRTTPNGYALAPPPDVVVDANECVRLVAAARAALAEGDTTTARSAFLAALDNAVGEVLPDDEGQWAEATRSRVERARLEALVGAARLAAGPAEAVQLSRSAVDAAPLHEPGHLLLVAALARMGDRSGALDAWEHMRSVLADELGLDPSAEARELQVAVLRDEVRPTTLLPPAMPVLPFVDRDVECEELRGLLSGPPTRIGVVLGQAGSGKTRLLQEAHAGVEQPVFAVRAFLAERLEPWGLMRHLVRAVMTARPTAAEALAARARAALGTLLPDAGATGGPMDVVLASDSRHALRREACLRLIASVPAAVVVVDDLQWADATSIDVLTHLADRRSVAALTVGLRSEAAPPGTPVARFLDHLDVAHTPSRIVLQPLTGVGLLRLTGDAQLADVLEEHTDRTPFAVAEVLGHLVRHDLIHDPARHPGHPLAEQVIDTAREVARQGQTAVLASRIRGRSPGERTVLRLLALLAREAAVGLVARAAGMTEETVLDALEGLHRAGLVRSAPAGWAPSHDLVAEAVRAELDDAERVRLHRVLAAGLRADGADHAEVATHFERAADPAAAEEYTAAVEDRIDRHAHREARDLAERALALPRVPATLRARLLEARGEVRHHLGELAASRADLREALSLVRAPADRSRILARMALAASGAEDIAHARELAELALVAAGGEPAARARALSVASILDFNTGQPERATVRAEEALGHYRTVGDTAGVADILDGRAMATFMDGRVSDAIEAFGRVAGLFGEAGDLLRVITPRSTRGHALVFAGRPAEGLVDIRAALDLAGQLGILEGRSYALWHQAESLAALGQVDEAAASAEEALGVARELGHRGWTATAHLARGIVRHAAGDPEGAIAAYDDCQAIARLDLFIAWAAGRAALCLVETGALDEAERRVATGLATGPPLGRFPARQAQVELALARGDPGAAVLAADALRRASAAGWALWADRLSAVAARG